MNLNARMTECRASKGLFAESLVRWRRIPPAKMNVIRPIARRVRCKRSMRASQCGPGWLAGARGREKAGDGEGCEEGEP